jgi:hypothetical protein
LAPKPAESAQIRPGKQIKIWTWKEQHLDGLYVDDDEGFINALAEAEAVTDQLTLMRRSPNDECWFVASEDADRTMTLAGVIPRESPPRGSDTLPWPTLDVIAIVLVIAIIALVPTLVCIRPAEDDPMRLAPDESDRNGSQ